MHEVHTYFVDNFTTNCGKSSKLKLCKLVDVRSEVVILTLITTWLSNIIFAIS